MKVKYIGESWFLGLTNGKIYECLEIDSREIGDSLRIIDDDNEDYLYSVTNPSPCDRECEGGKWEIIEDENGKLSELFKKYKLI